MSNIGYKAEEMASFFDKRAESYEEHMKQSIIFDRFYGLVAEGIAATNADIRILDIGCGTGLELEYIFAKAPNARVTCMDLSGEMLKLLMKRYETYEKQLEIVQASYVDTPFEENSYDYVISVYTMHHFLEDVKVGIYSKIRSALKPSGLYIEADYIVNEASEREALDYYFHLMEKLDKNTLYHIDIPFSMNTQKRLIKSAGFTDMKLLYEESKWAIFTAYKGRE